MRAADVKGARAGRFAGGHEQVVRGVKEDCFGTG